MLVLLFILVAVTVIQVHSTVVQGAGSADVDPTYPARIYGSSSSVKVGEKFNLRCSTFGLKRPEEEVFVYLCKNGVGIERMATESYDSIFPMTCATKEDTGNYSCLFSRTKHHPSEIVGEDESHISIKVTDRVYPAVISADKPNVRPGSDVNLRCTSADAPDTAILLAYLCRNQTIIGVEMWNCQKKQATFQLKTVRVDNTGSYSCVVAEQLLDATELDKCGGDSVFLQVFGQPSGLLPSSSSGAVMAPLYLLPSVFLLVLLLLLLWRNGVCICKRAHNEMSQLAEYEDVFSYHTRRNETLRSTQQSLRP